MAASEGVGRYVLLRGGLTVPADAFLLLFELEGRGFQFHEDGATTLVVTPPDRLTADDCARIRRWKWHLLALLAYGDRSDIGGHLFTDGGVPASGRSKGRRAGAASSGELKGY